MRDREGARAWREGARERRRERQGARQRGWGKEREGERRRGKGKEGGREGEGGERGRKEGKGGGQREGETRCELVVSWQYAGTYCSLVVHYLLSSRYGFG